MSRGDCKIVAAATAVCCASAVLSACTFAGGDAKSDIEPALSRADAARVLDDYVKRANATKKARDEAALNRFESGPQFPVETGKYKIADYHRKKNKLQLKTVGYERPTYYIPRFTSYPKWFAVIATASSGDAQHALVFARPRASQPWRISYAVVLSGNGEGGNQGQFGPLPRIETDREGFATAVQPDGSANSPVRPVQLPDAHASLNQFGVSGLGNNVVSAGPWTTGVADTVSRDIGEAKRKGFTYARNYHASGFPVYALETREGGAVVWYSVTDELSVARTRVRPRTTLRMATDMAGIIRRPSIFDAFQVSSLNQYIAVVPPQGSKARVIGNYGGPVGGVGR